MVVLLSPDDDLAGYDRVRLRHLCEREFIDAPVGYGTRVAVDQAFVRTGRPRNVTIEVQDAAKTVGYVREGLGIAIVPRSFVGDLDRDVVVKELDPVVTWAAGVAWLRGRRLGPASSAVLGHFRSVP